MSMFQCVTDFFVIDFFHRFPPYVYDVKTFLDELQNAVISGSSRAPEVSAHAPESVLVLTYRAQWFMVITIQTSMLIEGVMKIVEATTDIETRNHLRSKPVWDAASEYGFLFFNVSGPI